jgi:hypothetical protein
MSNHHDWRLIEIHHSNVMSISKAQNHYVTALLVYLALVWIWHSFGEGQITIQIPVAQVKASGFWPLTPLVVAILTLGILGTMSALNGAWIKLVTALRAASVKAEEVIKLHFYDLDTQKNILDFFSYLVVHPEHRGKQLTSERYRLGFFLYPALLAWGIYTTWYAGARAPHSESHLFLAYWLLCLGAECLFSVRVFWISICRFLGIRQEMLRRGLEPSGAFLDLEIKEFIAEKKSSL